MFQHPSCSRHVIKELVHAFSCAYIKLWMHLGSLESTQEARVALGYRLEQLLRSAHTMGLVPATSPCNKSQGLVASCELATSPCD